MNRLLISGFCSVAGGLCMLLAVVLCVAFAAPPRPTAPAIALAEDLGPAVQEPAPVPQRRPILSSRAAELGPPADEPAAPRRGSCPPGVICRPRYGLGR